MKLRFSHDSIRFRLRKPDVQALVGKGRTETSVRIGAGLFRYALELGSSADVTAEMAPGGLVVRLPKEQVLRWADSQEVGLYSHLSGGTRLLVEKDFACLEPREGDTNEGTYARPADEAPQCGAD